MKEIVRNNGVKGLYTGFHLHFRTKFLPDFSGTETNIHLVRDTLGTSLYFLEYDGMRHLLGRTRAGEQGPTPSWLPIHTSLVPFVCGSFAGVYSCHDLSNVRTILTQFLPPGDFMGPDISSRRVSAFSDADAL